MTRPLDSLEPARLWSHFQDILAIPRPSGHEERIAEHVAAWAADRGFEVRRDDAGTLSIRVPASDGHGEAPTVVLQGHLDMVCEKNSDVDHDFMTQGIEADVDGDWVTAKGTTLGADNGVGLAAALAVADDPEVVHGPLEILCTVDEESGLTGAKQLDPSIVSGRIMVNLDSEEDGAIYIGCAGGGDAEIELPLLRRRGLLGTVPARIAVRGLRGGHSGLNIIENRGNAIKLAARTLLAALEDGIEIDLASLDGGSKHNAIPREAFAVVRVGSDEVEQLGAVAERCAHDFREEFEATDPDLAVTVEALEDEPTVADVLNAHARDRLLRMIDGLPHGVHTMSRDVPGLVETSSNLAVANTSAELASITTSHRSSIMPALHAVRHQATSVARQAGARVTLEEAYPGWKPNPYSPIVQRSAKVYRELFGADPELKAIHAGLECGLIMEKVPGMDAVSIGPEIQNAHSPDERVQVSSVQKFYRHLTSLLADLA